MKLYYVLDFTQAPAERECYIEIKKCIELQRDTEWEIKANNNVYGKLQAVRVCNNSLVEKPTSSVVGFRKIKIDECVFLKKHLYTVHW